MMTRPRLTILTLLAAVLLLTLSALTGCSESSDPVAPTSTTELSMIELTVDPLDDVLKSTDGTTPAEPGDRIARLTEVLGLDEDQAAALETAYLDFRAAIAELRDQVAAEELTCEEARAEAILLREAFEAALQTILTPEQYDLLQEMRQNRHGSRIGQRNHTARWADWLEQIEADETQIETIMAAVTELRVAVRDLRIAVRNDEMTAEEAREAVLALRAEFETLLQDTLTIEQYEALLVLRPDCTDRT